MKELEKTLKALGNVRRLRMLKYLRENHDASVSELSKNTKCPYKTTSKHLSILFHVGLLEREQKKSEMRYSLNAPLDTCAKFVVDSLWNQ